MAFVAGVGPALRLLTVAFCCGGAVQEYTAEDVTMMLLS